MAVPKTISRRGRMLAVSASQTAETSVSGNDEIARTARIASLAKTGERVVAQPYDAAARAFRLGVRPTDDPNMLHV